MLFVLPQFTHAGHTRSGMRESNHQRVPVVETFGVVQVVDALGGDAEEWNYVNRHPVASQVLVHLRELLGKHLLDLLQFCLVRDPFDTAGQLDPLYLVPVQVVLAHSYTNLGQNWIFLPFWLLGSVMK